MWVYLNKAFLSIVRHRDKQGVLLVRARRAGELQAAFPHVAMKVRRPPGADYLYRAEIAEKAVGAALLEHALAIDYDNFKASVQDPERHAAYSRCWEAMAAYQALGKRARPRRR